MSGRLEMFRQPATRPMQANPEGGCRAAEDRCGLSRVETVPGDQAQDLALGLVEALEGARERVASVQQVRGLGG